MKCINIWKHKLIMIFNRKGHGRGLTHAWAYTSMFLLLRVVDNDMAVSVLLVTEKKILKMTCEDVLNLFVYDCNVTFTLMWIYDWFMVWIMVRLMFLLWFTSNGCVLNTWATLTRRRSHDQWDQWSRSYKKAEQSYIWPMLAMVY